MFSSSFLERNPDCFFTTAANREPLGLVVAAIAHHRDMFDVFDFGFRLETAQVDG